MPRRLLLLWSHDGPTAPLFHGYLCEWYWFLMGLEPPSWMPHLGRMLGGAGKHTRGRWSGSSDIYRWAQVVLFKVECLRCGPWHPCLWRVRKHTQDLPHPIKHLIFKIARPRDLRIRKVFGEVARSNKTWCLIDQCHDALTFPICVFMCLIVEASR